MGRFIVIEGLDGSGKSTQVGRLVRELTAKGENVEYLHFPRFDTPVYGELIARFLRGELGSIEAVDPHFVALIFAGDRAAAAKTIREWLDEGKWVITDRYVSSNIAYQCAKSASPNQLREWIAELEYKINGVPRPDVEIFLDVPWSFTEGRLREKREGADRDYLAGGHDIHEGSLELQRRVREEYLKSRDIRRVDCSTPEGGMESEEDIFSRIMKLL